MRESTGIRYGGEQNTIQREGEREKGKIRVAVLMKEGQRVWRSLLGLIDIQFHQSGI